MKPPVCIVVAIGKNRELGLAGKLLWHIPDDLKRFKQLTMGHPIIMGRKTFESILGYLGKPLPGRVNIVVTRDTQWHNEGVVVAMSVEEALEKARALNPTEIHIGGGAQIYEQVLPHVDKLFLTVIDDAKEADTYFPEYESRFPTKTLDEAREYEGLKYKWINLER
ncbi:MAG: dihydrofolate reductase [Candidatus Kaiserbacteria bacterium]|nr:dihydrofolate reductase [Candidatus Kaiserbacteria bacterium]